jgi:ketosteroid isomerase-like protein
LPLLILLLASCTNPEGSSRDLVEDPFSEAQAELRAVVQTIVEDAETANIDGLQSIHLVSDKFTKFGPRSFERQDVAGTNRSEAAHFGSISNFKQTVEDLKIDVFGDVAVVTYYPHVSFVKDGEQRTGSGRQTLVFLKTGDGWKIVHEHGTARPAP